ncbi:hypothetical protein DICVIV_06827 [Dictyocaulus viviparus]|uniref:Uncharacterized protein n=1 Tax=Dictyocaulus viviparus TaxID=29172 RepID=A0A0D8XTM0_DICVI|nr:hypothetical protein DICVIV_06827 [Dictyocaulus viviparus]
MLHAVTTVISDRKAIEKIIYDFYSNLFNNHTRRPPCKECKDDYIVLKVLFVKNRHAILTARDRTASESDRIKPQRLKNLPPVE